jgi:hypothetical protein
MCVYAFRPGENGRAFAVYAEIWKTIAVAHESSSPCEMQICILGFCEVPDLPGRQTVPVEREQSDCFWSS